MAGERRSFRASFSLSKVPSGKGADLDVKDIIANEAKVTKKKESRRARQRNSISSFQSIDLFLPSIFESCQTPIDKLDLIMAKSKEAGKSFQAIFDEFKHDGNGEINFEDFQIGLKRIIAELTADPDDTSTGEFREMFDSLDENASNSVDLKEFQEYSLKLNNLSWKAERLRQNDPQEPPKPQVSIKKETPVVAAVVVDKHLGDTITQLYLGPKFFWRSQTKIDLIFTQYELTNCIVITAYHEKLQVELDPIFLKTKEILNIAAQLKADHEPMSPSNKGRKNKSSKDQDETDYLSTCILARLEIVDDEESKSTALSFRDKELLTYDKNPGVEKFVYACPEPKDDNIAKFEKAQELHAEAIEHTRRSSVKLDDIMRKTRESLSALTAIMAGADEFQALSPQKQRLVLWARSIQMIEIKKLVVKYGYE
uniref:EF-hand domain-containing protein n=1 Tax=Octactis speculum TaxID=3111310 RepID=A0A7S2FIH1_9STRA|mmetsp:Transcript_22264/g.30370  ORF Transcript_22264/g.30370 Transcript_22264/m.30370 type:complete len:426 (+) Transcript_22264:56-1333(+)